MLAATSHRTIRNCAFYLGLPNERWDVFYGCNFNVTFDGVVGRDLTVDRDTVIGRNLTVNNHVISNLTPDQTATRYLGDATHRWYTFSRDLNADGNTLIGASCLDTLTVNATTTFKCPVTFESTVDFGQIGTGCSDTLTINATTTFKCPVTFENSVSMEGGLTLKGAIMSLVMVVQPLPST